MRHIIKNKAVELAKEWLLYNGCGDNECGGEAERYFIEHDGDERLFENLVDLEGMDKNELVEFGLEVYLSKIEEGENKIYKILKNL